MQAIEFWSTVCDCETSLLEDISDGDENATPYLKLVERAAPMLVPIMLETLTKQHVRTTLRFFRTFHAVMSCPLILSIYMIIFFVVFYSCFMS